MIIPIIIVVIFVAAGASVLLLANRSRATTGGLSRETRARDRAATPEENVASASASTEIEAAGRERADETRAEHGGVITRRRGGTMVEYEPVDEEELGVSRRQFLNRAVLTSVGFAAAGFGAAVLAFLWPFKSGGFGGQVKVDKSLADIKATIASTRRPYYVPNARTYIELYPENDVGAAKSAGYPDVVLSGMEQGVVALYQRCVHLGCRVPFCESSQWFECPCHGSKYNRVGEKTAGPAPRGLDHWPLKIDGGAVTINTEGAPINGAPIGTNTTKQQPEGPLCV